LFLFQQEAICVGPGFQNNESDSPSGAFSASPRLAAGKHNNKGEFKNKNIKEDSSMKSHPFSASESGDVPIVEGFRIMCNGRLQMSPRSKPAEKAESVVITRGVLPFNSFDQNIDFKQTYATNAYGTVGIKVWVHYIYRP